MKWLDNITNIIATHNAGKCPFRNSENTDYRIINLSSDIGYGDVWCNDCKKAFHISRMKISEDIIKNSEIPKSLNY